MRALPADAVAPSPAPVWGTLDRSLEIGDRRGCVGFGDRRFTSRDDLLTYVHWLLRDVFFQLPPDVRETTSSLSLLGRRVSLEVAPPGQRPMLLEGRESSTLGFRLAGSERLHLLQAFVLDRPAGRLWVRLSTKDGRYFAPGTPGPWTGVEVLPGTPSVAATTLPIAVGLVRIGD